MMARPPAEGPQGASEPRGGYTDTTESAEDALSGFAEWLRFDADTHLPRPTVDVKAREEWL